MADQGADSQRPGIDSHWVSKVMILVSQGRLEQAEFLYRETIGSGQEQHVIYSNLAAICGMQGRPDQAIALLRKSLKLQADHPEAHNNLGLALYEQEDVEAAITSFRRALTLRPDYAEAHSNLGMALQDIGDLANASASLQQALQLRPDYPEAHNNLGMALLHKGDVANAIRSFVKALRIRPAYAEAHLNLSLALLLCGDYQQGLAAYEWRSKTKKSGSRPHAEARCQRWDGHLRTGHLLLISEQGLGDTLQFMRYVTVLRERGFATSLCAPVKLHGLIRASAIDIHPLTPEQAKDIEIGHWLPLLSVPRYLNVSPTQPILNTPYIQTTEELIAKWRSLLTNKERPVIGINWQGNAKAEKKSLRGRSLALQAFAPLAEIHGCRLLSLQKGFGSEQLQSCSFRNSFVSCQSLIDETWDFLETAAIIANCDLVISSDTSTAHLAAGMGKPTWLLLQKVPDWRWGLEGDTSFWYPSMRLFRQNDQGNWQELMQRVAAELARHLQAKRQDHDNGHPSA